MSFHSTILWENSLRWCTKQGVPKNTNDERTKTQASKDQDSNSGWFQITHFHQQIGHLEIKKKRDKKAKSGVKRSHKSNGADKYLQNIGFKH